MGENDLRDGLSETVDSDGAVRIPPAVFEKLDIRPPGRICFRETAEGEVVLEAVKTPAELRGSLQEKYNNETSATEMLREDRGRDERKRDG